MKRKLLIVTLNDYIIYQPTILNLYDALISHFDVTVISFEPEFISKKKDETRNISYLKTSSFWQEDISIVIMARGIKNFIALVWGCYSSFIT